MRTISVLLLALVCMRGAYAQGRPIDWPLFGGDAKREGWEKVDSRITRENVKDFQIVLKQKLDNKRTGSQSLSAPVVIGLLISYRGFKELAFVSGSGDNVWSVDADLERMFWQRHFVTSGGKSKAGRCSAAATPSLIPPMNFSERRPPRTSGGTNSSTEDAAKPAGPSYLSAGGFGSARPVFTLASDGKLHVLNTSNGEDMAPAVQFIPAGQRASSLTFSDGFIYATTTGKCGGKPDAVWAIDLAGHGPPAMFAPEGGGSLPELGGLAIGSDGTVYSQTGDGGVLALSAKDLKPAPSFHRADSGVHKKNSNPVTPLVFSYKDRDLIVSASGDGLVLLDAQSLATPLDQTEPITAGGSIWGGLSSWEDADGTRWIYAPVWGPLSAGVSGLAGAGAPTSGAIVALKVEERQGKPALTPVWVSENMESPEPPVITGGVVFALAAGKYAADERPKGSSHAVLYAFDAATGKEMYSTKDQVTVPASLTGVTLANGRVYFTTVENTLYAFGVYLER